MGRRRLIYALLTFGLFFALVEAALWAAGVTTLLAERDPFQGFSHSVRAFELDPARGVWRTPPRAIRHSFSYQEFAEPKPVSGFRFFVIGGSTAVGFPWGADVAFAAVAGRALQATWPERRVEAVNAAAMSYGSHRLRILAPELLSHHPDALVIYSGHNEFVERRFYRDRIERPARFDDLLRLLYRSRIASSLERSWRSLSTNRTVSTGTEDRNVGELLGLDVDREYSTEVDDTERAEALAHYEENLGAILDQARAAGVPVVLCTVPSNLRDWRPNQSFFASSVAPADRQRVEALVSEASTLLDARESSVAATRLEQARALAPGYAETWFLLGRAYEALERWTDAAEAYKRARDLDGKPSRAIGAINDAIRRFGAREGVILVDVERRLEEASPHGIPGFDLFEDYVHLKPQTHKRVAFELWRAFQEAKLGGERDPAASDTFWGAVGPLESTSAEPIAAAGADTPQMLFNLAVVLENRGAVAEAMDKYTRCLELDPQYYLAGYNLARLLSRDARHAEAAAAYRRVLEIEPGFARAWIGLGGSLERTGDLVAAEQALRQAIEADPRSAHAWSSFGTVLVALERHDEAARAFTEAIALDPGESANRVNLGLTLLFRQQLDEAEAAFRETLELESGNPAARNGLAAVLTERGRYDDAERLFRESLALDPQDAFARGGLETLARRRLAGRER